MKRNFLIVAILTTLIAYEISNIYIIEDFESPWLYRFFYLVSKYVGIYVYEVYIIIPF